MYCIVNMDCQQSQGSDLAQTRQIFNSLCVWIYLAENRQWRALHDVAKCQDRTSLTTVQHRNLIAPSLSARGAPFIFTYIRGPFEKFVHWRQCAAVM
jgi:hypothetical protein